MASNLTYIEAADSRTIFFLPCSDIDTVPLKNQMATSSEVENTYNLVSYGNMYWDDEYGIYGINRRDVEHTKDNEYSTLNFHNSDDSSSPFTLEFYANVETSTFDNTNFFSIEGINTETLKTQTLHFSISNVVLKDNEDIIIKNILTDYTVLSTIAHHVIQIDPSTGMLSIYMDGKELYNNTVSELINFNVKNITFYMGYGVKKTTQEYYKPYEEQDIDNVHYGQTTMTVIVQHNIYYRAIRVSNFIRYKGANSNGTYTMNFDTLWHCERVVLTNNTDYGDRHNIIDLDFGRYNDINDNDMHNNGLATIEWTSNKKHNQDDGPKPSTDDDNNVGLRIRPGWFEEYDTDKAAFFHDEDTEINIDVKSIETLNNFTIETDFIIYPLSIRQPSAIFTIVGELNKYKAPFIYLTVTYYKENCILSLYARNPSTGEITLQYQRDCEYNYIYRLIFMRMNGAFMIFLNGKLLFEQTYDYSKFKLDQVRLGRYGDYTSFTGWFHKLIISDVPRYNFFGQRLIPPIIPEKHLFSVKTVIPTERVIAEGIDYIGDKDENHLVYIDPYDGSLRNRGSSLASTSTTGNVECVTGKFAGDGGNKCIVISPNSALGLNAELNLDSLTNFTIEMDVLLPIDVSPYDKFKLLYTEKYDIYMKLVDGYVTFYCRDANSNVVTLRHYYKYKLGSVLHIAIQRVKHALYLVVNGVLTSTYAIDDLGKFTIQYIYYNPHPATLGYIRKFAISNIARWNENRWINYTLDSESYIYMPFDTEYNFNNHIFPTSADNPYGISITNPNFYPNHLRANYGSTGSGTEIILQTDNKNVKTGSISTGFWTYLALDPTTTVYSSLYHKILVMSSDYLDSTDPNRYYFELSAVDSSRLNVKFKLNNPDGNSSDTTKTESLNIDISAVVKSLFDYWNHIAVNIDINTHELSIFVNGKKVFEKTSIYFKPSTISTIGYYSTYTYINKGVGNAYIASLRVLKGVYFKEDFSPTISGILAIKNDDDSDKDEGNTSDPSNGREVQYDKYPDNSTTGAIRITDGYVVNLPIPTEKYYTFEFWAYTSLNIVNSVPFYFNGISGSNILFNIFLSKYSLVKTYIHFSDHITTPRSNIVFPTKKWAHIAVTFDLNINKIRFWYNGINIITGTYLGTFNLANISKLVFFKGPGESYISDISVSHSLKYTNTFTPPGATILDEGDYAGGGGNSNPNIDNENINTTLATNKISNLDANHIVYLDFNDGTLLDKGGYNINWLSYGPVQYFKNKFPHDPNGKALYLNKSTGIYTTDNRLDFNDMNNFTIEIEFRKYKNSVSLDTSDSQEIAALFVSFLSWISVTILANYKIKTEYNTDTATELITPEVLNLEYPTYIAYQRYGDTLSLFVNGVLVRKYEGINTDAKLTNYNTTYSKNSKFNHSIDIGMSFNGESTNFKFFDGYINKIAISNIARFNDDDNASNSSTRNGDTIFYLPIKSPNFNDIYRTTPLDEPWYWRYLLRYSAAYTSIKFSHDSQWFSYASIGPKEVANNGYIAFSNTSPYHKTWTFEFWMCCGYDGAAYTQDSNILVISNQFKLTMSSSKTDSSIDMWVSRNGKLTKCGGINSSSLPNVRSFRESWHHIAIQFNNSNHVLQTYLDGKLCFTSTELPELIPTFIHLYTNKLQINPTYYMLIRHSRKIMYPGDFNISIVSVPYPGYNDFDIVDFSNLPISNDQHNFEINGGLDSDVICYLPFRVGQNNPNAYLPPGVECHFDITTNNSDLHDGIIDIGENPDVWSNYQAFGPLILINNKDALMIFDNKSIFDPVSTYTIDFWFKNEKSTTKKLIEIRDEYKVFGIEIHENTLTAYITPIDDITQRQNLAIITKDIPTNQPLKMKDKWSHFALSFDSSSHILRIHINGRKVAEFTTINDLVLDQFVLYSYRISYPIYYTSIRVSKVIRFIEDIFDLDKVNHPYEYYINITKTIRSVKRKKDPNDHIEIIGSFRGDIDDYTAIYHVFNKNTDNLATGPLNKHFTFKTEQFTRLYKRTLVDKIWMETTGSLGPASKINKGKFIYTYDNTKLPIIYNHTTEFWFLREHPVKNAKTDFFEISNGLRNFVVTMTNEEMEITHYKNGTAIKNEIFPVELMPDTISGNWHHFAFVYKEEDSTGLIFIDGKLCCHIYNLTTFVPQNITLHMNVLNKNQIYYTGVRISSIARYINNFDLSRVNYPFNGYANTIKTKRKVVFDASDLYLTPMKTLDNSIIDPHIIIYLSFKNTNPSMLWNSASLTGHEKYALSSKNTDLYPNKIFGIGNNKDWENYSALGPIVLGTKEPAHILANAITEFLNTWTVEFWAYKSSKYFDSNKDNTLIEVINGDGYNRMKISMTKDSLNYYTDNANKSYIREVILKQGLPDLYDKWNHYAFTYDKESCNFTIFINGKKIYTSYSLDNLVLAHLYVYLHYYKTNYTLITSLRVSDIVRYFNNFDISLVNKPWEEYINVSRLRRVVEPNITAPPPEDPTQKIWRFDGSVNENTLLYFPIRNSNKIYDIEKPINYQTGIYQYDNPWLVAADYCRNYNKPVNNLSIWKGYNPVGPYIQTAKGNIHIINSAGVDPDQFTIEFWMYKEKKVSASNFDTWINSYPSADKSSPAVDPPDKV